MRIFPLQNGQVTLGGSGGGSSVASFFRQEPEDPIHAPVASLLVIRVGQAA